MNRPEATQRKNRQRESNGQREYGGLVTRFRKIVRRAAPPGAVVAVISKGDHELLDLGSRQAWHFPQRDDGTYAGYYPEDSANAIAHLEALREKGADFLALPATALWWLDHYTEFAQHLESRYRSIVRREDTCVIYELSDVPSRRAQDGSGTPRRRSAAATAKRAENGDVEKRIKSLVDDDLEDEVRTLFDATYYSEQVGLDLGSPPSALLHYLERGYLEDLNPHPLFDARWYLRRRPEVRPADANPLIHFLKNAAADGSDPSPYFDTEYYYAQRDGLRDSGVNALVHYLGHARDGKAMSPNPLFQSRFYLQRNSDVRGADQTPFAHFLEVGCRERRPASQVHMSIIKDLHRASRDALLRGRWKSGTVLLFCYGEAHDGIPDFPAVAHRIQGAGHVSAVVVALRMPSNRESDDAYLFRASVNAAGTTVRNLLLLDDYSVACGEIFRPSALRLLAKMLAAAVRPLWAISEVPEVLEALEADGVGTYLLVPQGEDVARSRELRESSRVATRVIFPSSDAFHAAADSLGGLPTNVALATGGGLGSSDGVPSDSPERTWTETYTQSLLELAHRDFGYDLGEDGSSGQRTWWDAWPGPSGFAARPIRDGRPKIVIPCADWAVSGVNSVIERLFEELTNRGWDVEMLFSRDEAFVRKTSTMGGRGSGASDDQGETQFPSFPYRFLSREGPGLEGMWAALIAYLETNAPCILLMAYDFFANSVAPALTDAVGLVCWVQADDGDWNEQAYRLGRYCNAVVCVAETMKDKIAALNPAIGERTMVINNSSVMEAEVLARRPKRTDTLRIVYQGRLVQYQKRIMDFVSLAQALDRAEVPYEITLIGGFWARVETEREETEQTFKRLLRAQIEDGRVRLLGGMARAQVLDELGHHDFFVLLSDFEGLPLAMVEAMARGCIPVFPQWESDIPELVQNGKNGLVVSGRDYDEWASLLIDLWRDRARLSQMSRSARAAVRKGFTVEALTTQFEALFERVAGEMTPGSNRRPPSLTWRERSWTGDVLPPPSVYRPGAVEIAGMR